MHVIMGGNSSFVPRHHIAFIACTIKCTLRTVGNEARTQTTSTSYVNVYCKLITKDALKILHHDFRTWLPHFTSAV